MRAMRLKHGVIFVEQNGITLRLVGGRWGLSPVMYDVLEWDLRGEGPDAYECFSESDLRGLGERLWSEMLSLFEKTERTLGCKK